MKVTDIKYCMRQLYAYVIYVLKKKKIESLFDNKNICSVFTFPYDAYWNVYALIQIKQYHPLW